MRSKLPAAVGCLAAMAMASAASAQAAPKPAPAQPSSAEPLSRSNFLATMDSEYRKLDSNRDNVVSRAELAAHQQKLAQAAIADRARALFASIDSDRNGQISVDEFIRANSAQAPKTDVAAILARLDSNRDEKVTLVEYRTLTLATFDRLDTDKDGVLSVAEQRAGGFVR